jgi:uncharacterized protein YbbC (DUF1343 family)
MDRVVSGLERLIREGPSSCGLARGARVGLLGHPASIDANARHAAEWLRHSPDYELTSLFAPEHGLWGCEQDMEPVRDAVDPRTGLRVTSLYGTDRDSLRPDPDSLDGLDAIFVDLQDVGSRYYTFIYTMGFVMETAGRTGISVIVLDRPNPIGGETVEGPVLQDSLRSFVGEHPLPVRHGMTIAELASLFRGRFGLDCDLRVVTMEGWKRAMHFSRTGLPWVPPSPNMPTPRTATVYPGGCLVEGTNLSEGRGTTTPFELVGAPWLDPFSLAERMGSAGLTGVLFRPATFRPMFQKHAGVACHGVQVMVSEVESFRPFRTYLALLREILRSDDRFAWRSETYEFESDRPAIDYLLGVDGLREALETSEPLDALEEGWSRSSEEFRAVRREYLLYE